VLHKRCSKVRMGRVVTGDNRRQERWSRYEVSEGADAEGKARVTHEEDGRERCTKGNEAG
jgi:hypothetical protein